ncbi:MAG: zinc-dependent metalloprotease [Planctomycetota bacterium]|jgi:hypothetical protein
MLKATSDLLAEGLAMCNRLSLLVVLSLLCVDSTAQRNSRRAAQVSFAEATENARHLPGFFDLYWDEEGEKLLLEIDADQWEQEFMYVISTPANVSGSNRGSFGGTRVLRFSREGKKIFLIQSNYSYRAESDDPLEVRAVTEAYYPAIIEGFRPHAEGEGKVLIDATDFFMGSGDRDRSAFYWDRTKNFPKNTEVEVTVTTTSSAQATAGRGGRAGRGRRGGGSGARTIRRHHSLIALPDDGYKPRKHDQRAGIGGVSFMDYAAPLNQRLGKRYISRHRLHKKDPAAAVSEPVEPIVYYVDSGAPEPVRSALVEGASWWNQAFEAIGFKNAFQVEVLPADADPMDLRYNVILWIHRPSRGWSSGSSVRDPRTGEIIAGRVFLGSQRVRQDFMIGTGLMAAYAGDQPETKIIEEMILARTRQLSAHEVGHTLGFSHNFAASTMGRESVMDYPHPTVTVTDAGELDFSDTYDVGIGEWDKVSVAYAYSHFEPSIDEEMALNAILDEAHARGMYYNQSVGEASASPSTHQWDNGSDALAEFENVSRVRAIALANMSEKNIPVGAPMAYLEEVLVPIYLYHRYQVEAVSKSLGGMDYRYALRGDGQLITQAVPAEVQRRALSMLLHTLSPEFLEVPEHIRDLIPPREGRGGGEVFPRYTRPGFDPLAAAETAANHSLGFILNPNRCARLIQQHALDSRVHSLGQVFDALLDHTWRRRAPDSPYHAEIGRSIDAVTLNRMMALAANSSANTQVRATAAFKLDELKNWLQMKGSKQGYPEELRAHYHFGAQQISHFQADPSKFELPEPALAPAGAPIGMGELLLPGMQCGSELR